MGIIINVGVTLQAKQFTSKSRKVGITIFKMLHSKHKLQSLLTMTDLAEDKVIFQKVKQTQIAQNCSKLQSFKIKSKIAQNY